MSRATTVITQTIFEPSILNSASAYTLQCVTICLFSTFIPSFKSHFMSYRERYTHTVCEAWSFGYWVRFRLLFSSVSNLHVGTMLSGSHHNNTLRLESRQSLRLAKLQSAKSSTFAHLVNGAALCHQQNLILFSSYATRPRDSRLGSPAFS